MLSALFVGNPLPLHVTEAPETAHPEISRLAGLTITPAATAGGSVISAITSGILSAQSPAKPNEQVPFGVMCTIEGLVIPPNELPTLYRWPSYAPKKNALFLIIGPPRLPPNCSRVRVNFVFGASLKKFRASITPSRPKPNAVPCSLLVPDFRPTLTTAPGFHPYSAGGFCCKLNS